MIFFSLNRSYAKLSNSNDVILSDIKNYTYFAESGRLSVVI